MQRFFKHLLPPLSQVHTGPIKSLRVFTISIIVRYLSCHRFTGYVTFNIFYYLIRDKFDIFVQIQSAVAEKVIHSNLCEESPLIVNLMTNPSKQVVS